METEATPERQHCMSRNAAVTSAIVEHHGKQIQSWQRMDRNIHEKKDSFVKNKNVTVPEPT
jgi:hypothetical protein